MPRWRSIWLVARREILERGRSRGFIFSVLFTTAIVVGSFLIPALLVSDSAAAKIGVVQPPPPALEATVKAVASGADRKIALLPYPDRAAAEAGLFAVVAVVVNLVCVVGQQGEAYVVVLGDGAAETAAVEVAGREVARREADCRPHAVDHR